MSGVGGTKGLFQMPSGTHRPAWGEKLAGAASAAAAASSDPASARAAWQSVLTSLGVGTSEPDAQEPAVEESLDSDLGALKESATESKGARPFTSGSMNSGSLGAEVHITPLAGQTKSRYELAGQQLPGNAEIQQRAGVAPGIPVGKAAPRSSGTAEASFGVGCSKDSWVSGSVSADSSRKRKSLPAPEEATASTPQMAPLQSSLIPSQPILQNSAVALPPGAGSNIETLWQEKNSFATAQPENASGPQLSFTQGQSDWAPARTPLAQEVRSGDWKKEAVPVGEGNSQPQRLSESASGSVALKEDVTTGLKNSLSQGVNSSARVDAPLTGEIAAGGRISGPPVGTAEPFRHPVPLQIGAAVESNSAPTSLTPVPAPGTPLGIPIETGTIPASSTHPDAVKAAQTTWNAPPARNGSLESKPGPITKGKEVKVISRVRVQDSPAAQSAAPTSIPTESTQEKNASVAVHGEVALLPQHGTPGVNEISGQVIHSHVGSGGTAADAVASAATSGNAVGMLPIPPSGSPSTGAGVDGRTGVGETFTALDAGGASRVTWVHAGAQRAEAGFQDPSLGWVSVRADVSGGAIHAALVPASANAAQVMGGQLEGLNSYLSAHHSGVETITLAAPSGRTSESAEFESSGQGAQQGSGQSSSQESEQNQQRTNGGFSANGQSNADSEMGRSSASSMGMRDAEQEIATQPSATGGRISVMA